MPAAIAARGKVFFLHSQSFSVVQRVLRNEWVKIGKKMFFECWRTDIYNLWTVWHSFRNECCTIPTNQRVKTDRETHEKPETHFALVELCRFFVRWCCVRLCISGNICSPSRIAYTLRTHTHTVRNRERKNENRIMQCTQSHIKLDIRIVRTMILTFFKPILYSVRNLWLNVAPFNFSCAACVWTKHLNVIQLIRAQAIKAECRAYSIKTVSMRRPISSVRVCARAATLECMRWSGEFYPRFKSNHHNVYAVRIIHNIVYCSDNFSDAVHWIVNIW